MEVTLSGSSTAVNPEHPLNANSSISERLSGNTKLLNAVQFWKAWLPILVTLEGNVIVSRLLQL